MSRSTILIRPLVVAAAIAALAAPAAFAAPSDVHSPGHPSQDVRQHTSSPAGTKAPHGPVFWSYAYQAPDPKYAAALAQEQAYSSYVKAPDPKYAAALAQEQAYSSFVKAKPIAATATDTDDDTPWAIIGLSISAALLALLAATTVVVKSRRAQRVAA